MKFSYRVMLFLLLEVVAFFIFFTQSKTKIEHFLEKEREIDKYLFDTSLNSLSYISDTVFYLNIDKDWVKRDLVLATKDIDKARFDLYTRLLYVYNYLKKLGVSQFHFHSPSFVSIIRFHYPDIYEDYLGDIRYSLRVLKKVKHPIRGFEEGKFFYGYRNLYPLFYHNKYVGSVEISFSMKPIIDLMFKEEPAFYGVIIDKEIAKDKMFRFLFSNYTTPAKFSNKFVWDKKILEYSLKRGVIDKKLLALIEKKVEKVEDGVFYLRLRDYYTIDFLPIKNFKNRVIGYFVVIKKDKFLRMAINNLILLMTLATLLNMVIVVLAHLYFKNTESKLKSLKEESLIDPLTKLFNRRGFFEKISDDKEYSIIFADIDFFKKINDTYGHDVGDKILKEVASILKKHIRKGDLIARWGGEEFLIYLPFTSKKEGITIANKLRDVIKASDISPKITLSFGIAHSSEGDSLEEILKIADERLYKAKELGRDKVIGD